MRKKMAWLTRETKTGESWRSVVISSALGVEGSILNSL
jgi:hypothetical protein